MKILSTFFIFFLIFAAATTATFSLAQSTTSWCSQSTGISTYFDAVTTGSLVTSGVSAQCSLPQYVAVAGQQTKGTFQFNLKGDYVYTAPSGASGSAAQGNDVIFVDVFCFNNQGVTVPLCRQTFVAQVAAPFTLAPSANNGQTTTPAPSIATCPVTYHFTATINTVLSASLRTTVGQPSCPYGTWFEIGRQPNFGTINLVANGDFSYMAPSQQTWDDFSYTLYCFNDVLCKGTAYLLATGTASPTDAPTSAGSGSNANGGGGNNNNNNGGGTVINKPFLTCAGSCAADSWKATPDSPPFKWDTDDTAIKRSDGQKVGTVRATYVNGSIVLIIYGKIGNLGQRFPTFEPVAFQQGETFSSNNVINRVSASSLGFAVDCLARQPNGGMGEEVWHWKNLINRSGELGPYHAAQSSWYQKFGGGHDKCDTFKDSCTFAPLLTPNSQQDPAQGGVWSVDIKGCDITWTGRFSLAALRNMKTKSGASVWTVTGGRQVRTTLYLQAVQPSSWLQPIMGYETNLIATPLLIALDPDVTIQLDSTAAKLFSIDTQFNTRLDATTGDYAFDLNLRLYPHVVAGATTSYRADRHVAGFRWIAQNWITPDKTGCPSCIGQESSCSSNPRGSTATFFSADQTSSCTNPVVVLSKGPGMSPNDCIQNLMYIYNRPGLSTPEMCGTTFQNLTIRGVAPGSHASASFFGFEGSLTLQLILDTGISVVAKIAISRFVSMMSVDGKGITGQTTMCRATQYWPVLDPLGTSLPSSPFFLSQAAADAATQTALLCAARTRTVGPTTWATVMLDVAGYRNVIIESLFIEFSSPKLDETVYFINRDPVTGLSSTTLPAGGKNVWWNLKYPFFNFRDLSELLAKNNHSSAAISVADYARSPAIDSPEVDFAIAFTPGAMAVDTAATLTFTTRSMNEDGTLGGQITLRTLIHVDKMLADRDVEGLRITTIDKNLNGNGGGLNLYYAVAVTGGLIAGVIIIFVIYVAVDSSKPLPSWIPNAHELREVILLAAGAAGKDQEADEKAKQAARRAAKAVDGVSIPTLEDDDNKHEVKV